MTNGGKILIIAIATLILALTAPINAQQLPPGPSSTPQYFTCTEIIPTISGSNLTHVIVWLRLSNVTTSNGLLSLLNQMYYNPFSPYFHKFITPQQFASWYSPPNYVFTYIENLATQYGLIVNYTFPMLIEATGNASSVDNLLTALQSAPANITQWILSGECIPIGYFYVNSKAPVFKPQYEMLYLNTTNVNAVLSTNVTVINGVPLQVRYHGAEIWLPKGLEFIYDELPLFNGHTYTGYTGKGVTIAIVDAFGDFAGAYEATFNSSYVPSKYVSVACNDLKTFSEHFDLPYNPTQCSVIYPTGIPMLTPQDISTAAGWAWETALDIEYAHTMAPGANILLVVSPDSGDDLFVDIEYVVAHHLANFISLSWGAYEDWFYLPPPSYNLLYAYDEIFMQAAAEGIGVFAGSGDWGAFDVFIIPFEPSTFYPASDPWVTGVGGTELYVQFINGITQRMETAWNWNPYRIWGSGGGYSFAFNEMPGQALVGMPYELQYVYEPTLGIWFSTVGHRGVPDIAADADPFTGVLIVLNGVLQPYLIGGTSLATPLSAGMAATVQSAVPAFTIGDLAPNLYLVYHYMPSETYVSITNVTGLETSSFFTGIPGAMFPTLGGDNGLYWAVPGMWNPVTGLGQINVYGLAQALNSLANK